MTDGVYMFTFHSLFSQIKSSATRPLAEQEPLATQWRRPLRTCHAEQPQEKNVSCPSKVISNQYSARHKFLSIEMSLFAGQGWSVRSWPLFITNPTQ